MLPLFCGFLYNPQITIKCQTYISLLVNSHISTYEQLKMNIASFGLIRFYVEPLKWLFSATYQKNKSYSMLDYQ